jgi:hypothetical protein
MRTYCTTLALCMGVVVMNAPAIMAQSSSTRTTPVINYRDANHIESLRVLGTARLQYRQIVETFIAQGDKVSSDEVLAQLPVAIGAAFRLSVVTARDNMSSQRTLTYQLETYEDTHQLIDKLLLYVLNLRKKDQVSRITYETLLFARAYNRIAWAYQLTTATPWKQYVVLPFSQISGMLRLAEQDLEQVLLFQELPIPPMLERRNEKALQLYTEILSTRLAALPRNGTEYQVYQLLNQEDKPEVLAQIIAKRSVYQTLWVLETLKEPAVAKGLDIMSRTYAYESSTGPAAGPIFEALETIVRSIGLK